MDVVSSSLELFLGMTLSCHILIPITLKLCDRKRLDFTSLMLHIKIFILSRDNDFSLQWENVIKTKGIFLPNNGANLKCVLWYFCIVMNQQCKYVVDFLSHFHQRLCIEHFWILCYSSISMLDTCSHSSLSVVHKVGNVGIFALLKHEFKSDGEITYFSFNSKHHDKFKFVLKLI